MKTKHSKKSGQLEALCVALMMPFVLSLQATGAPPSKPKADDAETARKPEKKVEGPLKRLDFRIEGKSCAVCLLGIENRMKKMAGSVFAVVELKPPYGALVIYDGAKTSKDEILKLAQGSEKEVTFTDVKDQEIKRIPIVKIPFHF